MRDLDNQSPDAIEEQIEETRHHLSDTLSELQRRLSTRDIYQEAVTYLKSNQDIGRNLTATVRENPVPIGLIGLGVTWLIASNASANKHYGHERIESGPVYRSDSLDSSSGHSRKKERARETMDNAKSKASDAKDAAKDKLQDAKSTMSRKAESAKGSLSGAAHQAQHQGDHMKESYENTRQNARNKGSEIARNMRDGYQQRTHQVRHQAHSLIEERPLAVVAIGFGIGAALGLMIPSTQRENRLMGETRDSLKDRALEEGHERVERAREQVESAARATREHVQQETRSGSSSRDSSSTGGGTTGTSSTPPGSPTAGTVAGGSPTAGNVAGASSASRRTEDRPTATSPTQSPGTESPLGGGKSKNPSSPGRQP